MNKKAKVKTILANRINCSADKLTVSDTRIIGFSKGKGER
jgi:hypothetical protein